MLSYLLERLPPKHCSHVFRCLGFQMKALSTTLDSFPGCVKQELQRELKICNLHKYPSPPNPLFHIVIGSASISRLEELAI